MKIEALYKDRKKRNQNSTYSEPKHRIKGWMTIGDEERDENGRREKEALEEWEEKIRQEQLIEAKERLTNPPPETAITKEEEEEEDVGIEKEEEDHELLASIPMVEEEENEILQEEQKVEGEPPKKKKRKNGKKRKKKKSSAVLIEGVELIIQ